MRKQNKVTLLVAGISFVLSAMSSNISTSNAQASVNILDCTSKTIEHINIVEHRQTQYRPVTLTQTTDTTKGKSAKQLLKASKSAPKQTIKPKKSASPKQITKPQKTSIPKKASKTQTVTKPKTTAKPVDTPLVVSPAATIDISANYYDFPVDADGDGINDTNIKIHIGISGEAYMREHWYDYFSETTVNPYANPSLSELESYYISGYQANITEKEDHTFDVSVIIKDGFHLEGSYKKSITFTLPDKALVNRSVTSAEANIGYLASEDGSFNDQTSETDTFMLMPREDGKSIMIEYSVKPVRENGENILYLLPTWGCPVADFSYKVTYLKKPKDHPVTYIGGTELMLCSKEKNVVSGKYKDVINSKYVTLTFSKDAVAVSDEGAGENDSGKEAGGENNYNSLNGRDATTPLTSPRTKWLQIFCSVFFSVSLLLMAATFALIIWNIRKICSSSKEEDFDFDYMNPLNTELLNGYGKATTKGIIALLINLAVRGYIIIERTDTDYILHKNFPYDGDDENEEQFLEGLFQGQEIGVDSDVISCSSPVFKVACKELLKRTNCKENVDCIYETTPKGKLFMILPILSTFSLILSTVLWFMIKGSVPGVLNGLFICSWLAYFILVLLKLELPFFCRLYTEEGDELLREILAEKRQIWDWVNSDVQFLLEDDPDYAYKLLPYADIWGLYWKWKSLFSVVQKEADYTKAVCEPEWFLDSRTEEMVEGENEEGEDDDGEDEIENGEDMIESPDADDTAGDEDTGEEDDAEDSDVEISEDTGEGVVEEDIEDGIGDEIEDEDIGDFEENMDLDECKEYFFEEEDIPKVVNPMCTVIEDFVAVVEKVCRK